MQRYDGLSRDELLERLRHFEYRMGMPSALEEVDCDQMELMFSDHSQHLADIFHSAMDAIVTIDEEQRICQFNPAAEQMFKLSLVEAIGQPVSMLIPERFRDAHAGHVRNFHRVSKTNRRLGSLGELRGLRSDGEEFPIEASISRTQLGDRYLFSIILRDISDRKQNEAILRQSRQDLERAQAVGHIGSWRLNVLNNELTWSEENHRIFGIPRGIPLTYETFLSSVHPDDREYVDRKWQAGLRGEPYDIEHRLIVDGRVSWVRERAELEFDEAGRLLGGFGTTQVITEKKLAEEALREADRRKDEFIALLGHELRNPLAPIRNALEILKLKAPADQDMHSALGMIDRQLSHMVRLVDDLLDVGRISHGKLELRRSAADLCDILRQSIAATQPLIEQVGHRLELGLPPQPIPLDADPVRLCQVFLNLLNNACKYTEPGGWIGVEACLEEGDEGGQAVIRVRDNGSGISRGNISKLFGMFSQIRTQLDHCQSGVGIGLWLAKELVEMHGGSITAWSEGIGRGSLFTVRLPVAPGLGTVKAEPVEKPAQRPSPVTARRILVVDDNHDIVDSLSILLEMGGNRVFAAYDGIEAVEMAERHRPDVVLLDIGMPRLDGLDACRRIRELPWGSEPLIIALTGWGQERDRAGSRMAGFDGHLVKPVDPAELMELIERLQSGI